jgi:predicted secreted protein
VDFVSQVWNNFGGTVLPLCGGVAQEAVRTNRDPIEIGDYDSVVIQKEILASTHSKFFIPYW